jgi:tRNA threonylcarbamoyladenosine dehydratase
MHSIWQSRTELLLGSESLDKLSGAHVFIAGIGGVGGYTAEMLCRAGVGTLTIADKDVVHSTNRNRQLLALKSNEGRSKVEILSERLMDINPELKLFTYNKLISEETMDEILQTKFDYVADAIDTLSPKVSLIAACLSKGYPIVSSMGSGGKMDPAQIMISDISASYNCRLAYFLRKHLHKLGIREGFTVVFSPETVSKNAIKLIHDEEFKRSTVGTISYMPPIFGCYMASVIIRGILRTLPPGPTT